MLLNEGLRDLGCELNPQALAIVSNDYGKPYLRNGACFFNLSHSHQKAMVIFAQSEVGCDLERIAESDDAIVAAHFSPNEKALYTNAPQDKRAEIFYRIWVIRESFLKAIGRGLVDPIPKFSTVSEEGTWVPVLSHEGRIFWGQHGLYDGYAYAWWVEPSAQCKADCHIFHQS